MTPKERAQKKAEEHTEYVASRFENYSAERATTVSALLSVSERFDKWVIGLPAGAIVLSVTFYEKVASKTAFFDLTYLGWSWVLLTLAVLCGFLSLFLSTLAVGRQIEIIDEDYTEFAKTTSVETPQGQAVESPLKNNWNVGTAVANWTAVALSIAGVSFFLCFSHAVSGNLKGMSEKKLIEDGFIPPVNQKVLGQEGMVLPKNQKPPQGPLSPQPETGHIVPSSPQPKPKPTKKEG